MRAVSLLEPWASLVAIGAKRFITPAWNPSYRGRLAIHASSRLTDRQRFLSTQVGSLFISAGLLPSGCLLSSVGKVIAVAELVDVTRASEIAPGDLLPGDTAFDGFEKAVARGLYAWRLGNVRRIEPFPAKGAAGTFFFVPDSVEDSGLVAA